MNVTVLFSKIKATKFSFLLWLSFLAVISYVSKLLFPEYHFWADGGVQGIVIVTIVDFFLGPVLFFIVYNPHKPSHLLSLDVGILLLVQFGAMAWGGYQVYSQRPVVDAFFNGLFYSGVARPYQAQGIDPGRLSELSPEQIPMVYVSKPSGQYIEQSYQLAVRKNIPPFAQWPLLVAVNGHEQDIFKEQGRFQRYLRGAGASLWRQRQSSRGSSDVMAFRYAYFVGRYHNALLIFDNATHLAGYINLPGEDLPQLPK